MAKYENLSWGERSLVKNIVTDLSEQYNFVFNEALQYLMNMPKACKKRRKKGKRLNTRKRKKKADPVIVSDTESEQSITHKTPYPNDYKEDIQIIDTKVEEFVFKKNKYLRDEDDIIYDFITHQEIGKFNGKCIETIELEEELFD